MTRTEARASSSVTFDFSEPGAGERVWKRAIAFVHAILGSEWLERELDEKGTGGYLLLDGPDDEDGDPAAGFLRHSRLVTLALELDDAQRIPGFSHMVRELRTRNLYEAVSELRAVNLAARGSEAAWFIDPRAHDGPSYDAAVVLSGIEVAVEVKAKLPKPVDHYRPRLVENSLNEARRRQLPKTGPSMIYLQIASPWADSEDVLLSIDATAKRWLTRTKRVNAVILMIERTFVQSDGKGSITTGSLTIPNYDPHIWVPDIQNWTLVQPIEADP